MPSAGSTIGSGGLEAPGLTGVTTKTNATAPERDRYHDPLSGPFGRRSGPL